MPHYTKRLDKVVKALKKASKAHARQADILLNILEDQKTDYVKTKKRPKSRNRKKPKGSGRRLYTDENPKDTVRIKYATPADARATVAKVKRINKPYARKIQILTVMEQRSKFGGKPEQARIAKKAKESLKKKHDGTKKKSKKS